MGIFLKPVIIVNLGTRVAGGNMGVFVNTWPVIFINLETRVAGGKTFLDDRSRKSRSQERSSNQGRLQYGYFMGATCRERNLKRLD